MSAIEAEPVRATWQTELAQAIRDPQELIAALDLPTPLLAESEAGAKQFRVFVPRPFLSRMEPGNPADPLLRQVLPLVEEGHRVPGYGLDPLEELAATKEPGLLQKYSGRALLVTTGVCAIHCRYCFRRHFPYTEGALDAALQHIERDNSLEEVLLSGGDPLSLSPGKHQNLVRRLDAIPHLKRLRWHTRLPVVLPSRVNEELTDLFASLRTKPYVVIHANHAAELDASVEASLDRLREAGAILLNQAVLLRGVNDSLETLVDLSKRLVNLGVIPYYLHKLDPVAGAHHFEVGQKRGKELIQAMRAELPGYAVPTFVQELPGAASKVVV